MKQVDTEPGSQYSVDSAAGCTVSTPAGQVICRVMPGILGSFMASGYVTCFSDDAAGVTLVASGTPGGTGGQQMQISQALDAANRAEAAREKAEAAKNEAVLAMGDAAADAQVAAGKAADAEVSREAAEAAAKLAGARAAEAEAGAKVATEAVSDALAARDEAAVARDEAVGKAGAAEESRVAAEAAADDASVSRAVANAAQEAAEAAQSRAEEQAAIATAAAEAAQAPESIAAQAARPATMVLLKDELLAMLGDAALFDLDTEGQKIIVHTDRLDDETLAQVEDMLGRFVPQFIEVMRYNHHIEVSWRNIDKYAKCESVLDIYAVDPENNAQGKDIFPHFMTYDLTSDGEWVYPLPNLKSSGTDEAGYIFGTNNKLTKLHIYAPKCTIWVCGAQRCPKLEIVEGNLESVTDAYYGFAENSKLKSCTLRFPKLRGNNLNMFRDCILDKPSVVCILDSIPAYASGSHKLTIGIHVDHKTDEEVLAAIANAEAKGWTLSVIWNGTPTAQAATTYGLRKPPIYARVEERVLPEGTTERVLDWGHYVTDPTDYEEFRSVEAAREYYGLPEEDLTETE